MRFIEIKKGQYFKRKSKTQEYVKFKKLNDDSAMVIKIVESDNSRLGYFYKVGEIITVHKEAAESYEYDYKLT